MNDTTDHWALGWQFYRSGGIQGKQFLPLLCDDLTGWMKGFCAALADYDLPPQEHCSIEQALQSYGVAGELLAACLDAADAIEASDEWCRWPSVPVRRSGQLTVAANDDAYMS